MIRNRTTRTRRGFSLIELLAVIAILAVLTAIVVGVLGAVRGNAASRVTEETLSKLQPALDQQRSMVADRCRKNRTTKTDDFAALSAFCGGDDDRAEALMVYMNMRRDFPQSFVEATSPIVIPGLPAIPALPAKRTFASVAGATGFSADEQAAILLFLNLSEQTGSGSGIQADTISQGDITKNGRSFRVFRDAQGTHIAFFRHAQNAELNGVQYGGGRDLFDPKGKLAGTWANKAAAQTALGVTFDGQNKALTAVSAGPNKVFDAVGNSLASDDIFSYRVKKQGQRAD